LQQAQNQSSKQEQEEVWVKGGCVVGAQAGEQLDLPPSAFVTALLVPAGGAIDLERPALEAMGIRYACLTLLRA